MRSFSSKSLLKFWILPLIAASALHAAESLQFDLPSQALLQSLRVVGERTGTNVLANSSEIAGLKAPALRGQMTVDEAFRRLLAGSGLRHEFLDEKTVTFMAIAAKEDSSVSAQPITETSPVDVLRVAQAETPSDGTVSTPSGATNQSSAMLEEVVVTAQKRSQRLIDVPISIRAIDGETLERAGIDTLLDLSHAAPGFVVSDLGGGYMRYYVRGIGNAYGSFSSTLVGVYLDEADVTSGSGTQLDLRTKDIERIEVLKGPQGTLYGAGASGGAVRFITRDPELDRFSAEGDIDLSNTSGGDSSQSLSAVLNVPVVEDIFGLRVVGSYSDLGGWVDQPAAGRTDINDQELREIRIKGLWKPMESLTIEPMAYLHRNEGGGIASSTDERYVLVPAVDPARPTPFASDFDIFNLTATYQFPALTLLSSSSYVDNTSEVILSQKYPTQPPPGPLFEVLSTNGLYTKVFSQEVRLN